MITIDIIWIKTLNFFNKKIYSSNFYDYDSLHQWEESLFDEFEKNHHSDISETEMSDIIIEFLILTSLHYKSDEFNQIIPDLLLKLQNEIPTEYKIHQSFLIPHTLKKIALNFKLKAIL